VCLAVHLEAQKMPPRHARKPPASISWQDQEDFFLPASTHDHPLVTSEFSHSPETRTHHGQGPKIN
jgi:hypothetical protein